MKLIQILTVILLFTAVASVSYAGEWSCDHPIKALLGEGEPTQNCNFMETIKAGEKASQERIYAGALEDIFHGFTYSEKMLQSDAYEQKT